MGSSNESLDPAPMYFIINMAFFHFFYRMPALWHRYPPVKFLVLNVITLM